jgi:trimeric autotransporter adhesin
MLKINIKSVFFICCIFISINMQAQGINFQGVARSGNGVILASQKISLKLSIIASNSTGNTEYVESRIINTNAQGIFSIIIGDTGTISTTGNFNGINWKLGPKFLKVEMDPNAGTNFINMGTTQLQNVPYSFYTYGIDASNISGIVPIKSGGTGVSSIAELKTTLNIDKIDNIPDLNKPISNAVQTNLNLKLDKSDTTSLFSKIHVKLNKSDTNFLSNRINLKLDKSDTTSLFSKIDVKLNKSDTNFLSNRINLKLNKSDTNFLSNRINLKLNKPDTSDLIINQITAGKGNSKIISNTVFGIDALKINTTGYGNIAIGEYTLSKNTTGYDNTVVGSYAQNSNTSGSNNVAVGKSSLRNNTTGNNNTSVGSISLEKNTTGNENSAFGENSLNLNTTGNNNTGLGANTLTQNSSGSENVAVGSSSLTNNTIGNGNISIGRLSLTENTIGSINTALGYLSLKNNTTGNTNTAIGANALEFNKTGNENIAIGYQALNNNVGNYGSIAIGKNAMYYSDNTTNGTQTYNVAVGYESLKGSDVSANNTGKNNTAIGSLTLYSNSSGSHNTAIGTEAMFFNTTGIANIALGSGAFYKNTTGRYNVAVGFNSLKNNLSSDGNTAIGNNSLNANTTGADNVSIGSNSSLLNTSGNGNISIGSYALQKNITGTNNIAIGYNADVATSGLTNAIAIGYNSKNSNSNTIVLGNSQITSLTTSGKITTGTITLPNTDGTSGQVLATNGSGIVGWTTPATSSNSNSTNLTGIIIFGKNISGVNEVWKSNFDGSSQSKINIAGLPANYEIPSDSYRISADGQTIFFLLYTPTGGQHIYKCNIDGSGLSKIINDVDEIASVSGFYSPNTTHYVGESFGGGIIFSLYKGSDGLEHGLIVALTEQASTKWQNTGALVNATRSEDGGFNTALMTNSPAANYIKSLGAGWYLPSIDELTLLYNNRYNVQKALRAGSYSLLSNTGVYWSSTEFENYSAYGFTFGGAGNGGSSYPDDKTNPFTVRGVRAF